MSDSIPHVVFAGGGYVTINAVHKLRRHIRAGRVRCTVIDKNNFHTFHGLVGEMVAAKIQPSQIISPARRLFAPAAFHNALIESIDTDKKMVSTRRALDGRRYDLSYDFLVVSIGTIDNLSRYPGISEHAFKLKDYWACFQLRNQIIRMLELAEIEDDPEERQRLLQFVVAGGNYAGVEIASELADFTRMLAKREYQRIDPGDIRVFIVHSGKQILPELGSHFPTLIDYAENCLHELGVELIMETRMASATPAEVILNSGRKIATRTLVSCTGTAQSPVLRPLPFERDERGRILTDESCQVLGSDHVWAGGDCSAVPHPRGDFYPPLAIYAMEAGKMIGHNIGRTLQGKTQRKVRFSGLGDACALGGRRGVAQLKGVPLKGWIAWVLWRVFMLIYLPSWDRRFRTLSDWILTPFIGRDIVSVPDDAELGITKARYEPGQVIIAEGDTDQTMYVIQGGTVEVEQGGAIVGTLGPGSHFGEKAVFKQAVRTATIRAQSEVKLLVVRREHAQMLQAAGERFSDIVETPSLREKT